MPKNDRKIIYFDNNYCVACGKVIPEGQMVCQDCLNKETKKEYNNVEVTNSLIVIH